MAAGLEGTLSGDGPFTVFAPTDAAFDALPPGTLEVLLANTDVLTSFLTHHVVSGSVPSSDLSDGLIVTTLNGTDFEINIGSNGIFINGEANVTVADIQADNGVVHVINAVLNPTGSVVDVVVNSDDHIILETAVLATGLESTLSGDGPFTVFAPTDAAFDALPPGTLDALLADPDALADILLYHTAGANVLSSSLTNGQVATTVNGSNAFVNVTSDGIFINNTRISVADIIAENGVVHVIDAVLLPPSGSVVDVVVNSDDHNTLEAAVLAADLAGVLSGEGPFTIFAPTDAAFEALPDGALDALLADTDALTDVLLYHALGAPVFSSALSNGQTAVTINGTNAYVSISPNGVFINNARVSVTDILAENGVVHVIDAVLLPPSGSIVDVVVNSDDHNTLEAAVLAADLAGTLSGEGPFTVFAPTDAAFEALPDGVLDDLLADTDALTEVLLYHAIGAPVFSPTLSDGQSATTINGNDIDITIDANGVMINNALVTVADINTTNGVIHIIDAVLIPPDLSSVEESEFGQVKIFPNPTTETFQIQLDNIDGNVTQLDLYGMNGLLAKTWTNVDNQRYYSVRELESGMYLLRLRNDFVSFTQKIIIK